ncbi:unnamed protein product [Spirodela intermedia]|uniref:Uncharacterized protein n=1 Tax=Spirodela intermedia TaxID=51605 RepID=A0A7I8JS60_SPIIN|nr:unnamed protein product [Spirodela intermedia]CAA6672262.1 unnamed protein product [Spirodela intermedia]
MRGCRAEAPCSEGNSSVVGFESELVMVQHQVRGVFRVVDGCSFSVREFDMLEGSGEVRSGSYLSGTSPRRRISGMSFCRAPGMSGARLRTKSEYLPFSVAISGYVRRISVLYGLRVVSTRITTPSMIHADVAITGFTEEGTPFADDYYITAKSECGQNKDGDVQGVCPDTVYDSDHAGLVNNTKPIYGHRKDGVSFIRYNRPLVTIDETFDVVVHKNDTMNVIWALGKISPPNALQGYYRPQKHGALHDHNERLHWPLDAEDKDDQDLITADGKTPLVVVSGPALRYPNPPSPSNVLYINKKEAPLLRVERGVPVKFSIQAGHNVALYITSDPIGGNATSRNISEVVYAGGPDAEGVPATPKELVWLPDRKTPDQVYYQSLFEKKMGWKIQVVDGGLSDMYHNSVFLDDQQVTLFWTLSEGSISLAARGEKKSGYLAIGFGSEMRHSFAYVGWVDESGKPHVNTYWIDGRDASSLHPTSENLTDVRCKTENGMITFEFTRPFSPSCSGRIECQNVIEPVAPLRVIWAMGALWSEDNLSERNMHSLTSTRSMRVMLMHGSAEAEQDLRPVLAVHGFMMFVAWGMLLPGDGWFKIHVYLQYSGISIMLLGVLFAAAELRGFSISSLHVKFGITALILACAQPINAYLRPKKPVNGESTSSKRMLWEYFHIITGRCAVVVGIASLISGMKHLGDRYGGENAEGLNWALILWFLVGALVVLFKGNWVLGNEEDDSADLLHPKRIFSESENQTSGGMEVQLEPLHR